MAVRFHLDEHVPFAIAQGLRRRGVDVTTTTDARLIGAEDLHHIEFARREARIIYTSDADFLRHHRNGIQHCGIVYSHAHARRIGEVIDALLLVHGCCGDSELHNQIHYI